MAPNDALPIRRIDRTRLELAEALRTELVEAALAEFADRGYHQTSIAHIAKRVGVSSGTFYNYFKGKREILDHVIDALLERIILLLTGHNAPDAPSTLEEYVAQTRRIVEALHDAFEEDTRVMRMLLLQSTSVDAVLTERLFGLFDMAAALTAGYLDNGVRRGFFRADLDTRGTADAILGIIIAGGVRSLRAPLETDQRRALHEAAIRLVLDGISAAPRPAASDA